MRRREFITLLGGAAAWPRAARAQQGERMRRIGVLLPAAPDDAEFQSSLGAFLQGLAQAGWITGRNIRIETRWTKFDAEETRKYAAELVALAPDAIVATGNSTVGPLLRLTRTVPIVFPAAPSGNVTGITLISGEIVSKRIAVLRDLLPGAKVLGVLTSSTAPASEAESVAAERTAHTLGWQVKVLRVGKELDFDTAFQPLVGERVDALLVTTDPIFESQRHRIVALAARHAVPTIYALREYAVAGGLMRYGASINDVYRQAGSYVGRILKGEKPSDLPVIQSSKFELLINLKTAKTLGIAVPAAVLALADDWGWSLRESNDA
jgi:putative tryptophan/tyrosine transport system substrate-binding protein